MSIQIKSLTNDPPVKDLSPAAPLDTFNIIPTANEVYDLYTAPNNSTNKKAAIVHNIRVTNIKAQTVNITLYLNRPDANGQHRRLVLTPKNLVLQEGCSYFDDAEITLEPGDRIQGMTDTAGGAIRYLISGVERDAT